jgi:UDP-N-acetylmuramate--alanine ligase
MEQITESFARFASLTGADGVTVVNLDDCNVMESARRALDRGKTGRLVTFSAEGDPAADFRAESIRMERGLPCFELIARGECLGTVSMAVPGRHQVINALAAAAAMDACGISREAILSGLAHYRGAGRRMEYKGTVNGAKVYDDYGHHPTEVRATLEGAKTLCGAESEEGHLICVFQPHTYSRTAALYGEFLTAFDAADKVIFMDIYAAREDNVYGVSSAGLAHDINQVIPDKADFCATPHDAAEAIRSLAKEGDTVVIMGAGDVIKVTERLFEH